MATSVSPCLLRHRVMRGDVSHHQGLTREFFSAQLHIFEIKGGSEGPRMIGREDTGTLSTNHMRAFRPSFSKAETGFKWDKVDRMVSGQSA
jgi:hypothetical protein